MNQTVSAWLANSEDGYCQTTTTGDGGDCLAGMKGNWPMAEVGPDSTWHHAVGACAQKCNACPQCNAISLSLIEKDCSWYQSCEHPTLGGGVSTAGTFISGKVSWPVIPGAISFQHAKHEIPSVKRSRLRHVLCRHVGLAAHANTCLCSPQGCFPHTRCEASALCSRVATASDQVIVQEPPAGVGIATVLAQENRRRTGLRTPQEVNPPPPENAAS